MREVIVAKSAGFCFGVKRAVECCYKQAESGVKPIYTFGPIIHNEQVVSDLESRGVRMIKDSADLEKLTEGTVIIRSHGVEKAVYDKIRQQGLTLVDATCPFVRKIHNIVQEKGSEGADVIIIGSPEHPEVQGIVGWASGNVQVISSEEEAKSKVEEDRRLSEEEMAKQRVGKTLCIVSQTTFNYKKFDKLVEILQDLRYDKFVILNTICNATEERQSEARELAKKADVMIVIGGRHSSNTQKLYEICNKECAHTIYIQSPVDLDIRRLPSTGCLGITGGASTPNKLIEEVSNNVRNEF